MGLFGRAVAAYRVALGAALALILMSGRAEAQKSGGILRIPNLDSSASMSILEEATVVSEGPMMPVFNNLVLFDQHVAQNSLRSIVPDLATSWSWNDDKTQLKFVLRQGVTMTYRAVPGFVNVLYGVRIPQRDGKPLGGTEFSNMRRAYDELPAAIKTRLDGMTATHNIEKFWEHMRRAHNSPRPPMTDEQRRRRPPVSHPVFLTHPITGKKVLYCNPGFAERINELPERESEEMLEYLFAHQLQSQFRYTNMWAENDLLVWDHLGTLHRAIADYGPEEIRLIRRCQVMATKVFDPEFLRPAHAMAAAGAV